ncbi:MAG: NAD(P)/FAD-dependent oxidoreductase [Erysipelotrichaceae bacterium]|nr:NAD(P)/FAD-dependent oxidoreductase [Erysipelotrichaceae bacterium]
MSKLIIVGGGPAGISAALYAKRANLDVTVFYMPGSSLNKAHMIENYYGIEQISGQDLYESGIHQAQRLGIEMIAEEVLSLEWMERFTIVTAKNNYEADAVILATGAYRATPPIKGLKEKEGKGVSYCAVCDGFFYRKKRVAVLGDASYAAHEAKYLSNLTPNLYVLTNGKEVKDEKLAQYELFTQKIKAIEGEVKIERVVFEDDSVLEVDGLFVAEGSAGSVDLARKIGTLIDNNKIVVDEDMRTNVPGLYACGDCTKGLLQVSKAVYEGAQAATDAIRFLRNKA